MDLKMMFIYKGDNNLAMYSVDETNEEITFLNFK